MKPKINDITIPKELLTEFKGSLRIKLDKSDAGIWPVDIAQIKKLHELLPNLFAEKNITDKFKIAVGYKGKDAVSDLKKSGIEFKKELIKRDIFINGIPVPWHLLRKAGIDYKKISVMLTPIQM